MTRAAPDIDNSARLEWLRWQAANGWPDCHPEDYCGACGGPNISWYADSATWNQVHGGPGPIWCPTCFARTHDEVTGNPRRSWRLAPAELADEHKHLVASEASMRHQLDAARAERDRYLRSLPAEAQDYWHWRTVAEQLQREADRHRTEIAELKTALRWCREREQDFAGQADRSLAQIKAMEAAEEDDTDREREKIAGFVFGECPQGKHCDYAFNDGDGGDHGCPGCALEHWRARALGAETERNRVRHQLAASADGTRLAELENECGELRAKVTHLANEAAEEASCAVSLRAQLVEAQQETMRLRADLREAQAHTERVQAEREAALAALAELVPAGEVGWDSAAGTIGAQYEAEKRQDWIGWVCYDRGKARANLGSALALLKLRENERDELRRVLATAQRETARARNSALDALAEVEDGSNKLRARVGELRHGVAELARLLIAVSDEQQPAELIPTRDETPPPEVDG